MRSPPQVGVGDEIVDVLGAHFRGPAPETTVGGNQFGGQSKVGHFPSLNNPQGLSFGGFATPKPAFDLGAKLLGKLKEFRTRHRAHRTTVRSPISPSSHSSTKPRTGR